MSCRFCGSLVLALILLAGCGANPEVSAPADAPAEVTAAAEVEVSLAELAGTSWELESMGMPGDDVPALPSVRSTVNFLGERYAGSGGCNFFLGVYSVDGRELTVFTPATTAVVCEDPAVADQDATFVSALLNLVAYEIVDDKLLGYTAEDQLLITMVPAEAAPLQGTIWVLKLLNLDGEWSPVAPDSQVTLISDGEEISGFGGCNEYRAMLVREGAAVSLTDFNAAEQTCSEPEGVMDQEAAYFSLLQSAQGYLELAESVALLDTEGSPVLIFGAE